MECRSSIDEWKCPILIEPALGTGWPSVAVSELGGGAIEGS
jgi:hypothetical protein